MMESPGLSMGPHIMGGAGTTGLRLRRSYSAGRGGWPGKKADAAMLQHSPFLQLDSARLESAAKRRRMAAINEDGSHASAKRRKELIRAVFFGCINAGTMTPTMIGFSSIIYRDPFFEKHDYLAQGIKLVFLSSAIHQLCLVALSSLPFAVGQTQDAGLLFLSQMASSIVSAALSNGSSPSAVMATTVVVLSLCTVLLGVLLVLTGKFKLASLVQYLPLEVIGGYLAYIGLFCGLSGLRLTTGNPGVENVTDLDKLLNWHDVKLLIPGALATLVLFYVSKQHKQNQFALPLVMLAMPVVFYLALIISGTSLQEARDTGWLAQKAKIPPFYKVFGLFDFSQVQWGDAFPSVIPTFLAMFAVVAFGSGLDVAAIQFELGRPLDYDHELVSLGYSNIAAGCLGGYTGSYIFSQTLFTLRNGIQSRVAGVVLALIELLIFALPIDLMSVLPRFFFGSVLLFVSVDLILEWLVHSWWLVRPFEFLLTWATFVFINIWGLEVGMTLGFIACSLRFVISYSRNTRGRVEAMPSVRSHAVRSHWDQRALDKHRKRIVALKISGSHFFGTVIGTILDVQKHVFVDKSSEDNGSVDNTSPSSRDSVSANPSPITPRPHGAYGSRNEEDVGMQLARERALRLAQEVNEESFSSFRIPRANTPKDTRANRPGSGLSTGSSATLTPPSRRRAMSEVASEESCHETLAYARNSKFEDTSIHSTRSNTSNGSESLPKKNLCRLYQNRGDASMQEDDEEPLVATSFVVLDMSAVSAVDATAARASFMTLLQSLDHYGVRLIFCAMSPHVQKVFQSNGVIKSQNYDHGQTCQHQLGASVGDVDADDFSNAADGDYTRISFSSNDGFEDDERVIAESFCSLDTALQHCENLVLAALSTEGVPPVPKVGQVLPTKLHRHSFFNSSELIAAHEKYFSSIEGHAGQVLFCRGARAQAMYVLESGSVDRSDHSHTHRQILGGSLLGATGFFQEKENQTYKYTSKVTAKAKLSSLGLDKWETMKKEDPLFAIALQEAVIRHMAAQT